MGALYCLFCTLLVVFNVIYMIMGIVILAAGILLKVGGDMIKTKLKEYTKELIDNLGSDDFKLNFDDLLDGLLKQLSTISLVLIIVGVILFALTLIAMCGVCCKYKIMLIIYIGLISALLLAQIVVVIIYGTNENKLKDAMNTWMMGIIKDSYLGYEGKNVESQIINVMQIMLECCGSNNYTDYKTATKWKKEVNNTIKVGAETITIKKNLIFPITCCEFKEFQPVDIDNCAVNGVSKNKNIGCISSLFKQIKDGFQMVLYFVGGIIGVQALCLLAAIVCLCTLDKEKEVK